MKLEDFLGLVMRRNTLHQEGLLLIKAMEELELEMAKCKEAKRRIDDEQVQLTNKILTSSYDLEMIQEWHWENTETGERIEPIPAVMDPDLKDKFDLHLKKCSEQVAAWPQWKKDALKDI